MGRKPRTQPIPDKAAAVPVPQLAATDEAAVPARRGRKPKAAALSLELPSAASVGDPATDASGTDAPRAGPAKEPGRRGPGRKPKQAASAKIAPAVLDDAAAPQDQAPHQPEAEANPDLTGDDAPAAAAVLPKAEAAADSDPVQPDSDPAGLANEAAQSVPDAEASVPAKPAAHWDRAADRVQFDWPAIEQVAAQGGPNQGMAKLLVAARADGAQSRWPF